MAVIAYNKTLDIRNVESLPHGLNCKYLEVITAHLPDVYIAKQWHRKMTTAPDNAIIYI
jgi:hypothetical protein